MNIQNLNDEELAIEIRGRCITNMAADDLVKFIRQCVADSQRLKKLDKEAVKALMIKVYRPCYNKDMEFAIDFVCNRFGTPSKPEPTIAQKLLKAQELHGGVTYDDKLVEENKMLREALRDFLDTVNLHSIGVNGCYRSVNDGELEQMEERAKQALAFQPKEKS